jgi:8-oxo-dGTP diphosphatase
LRERIHHEVAAGILVRHSRVLLGRRRGDRDWYPGGWDVVGGHRKIGESMEAALRRECREELGIAVSSAEHLLTIEESTVTMSIFVVTEWIGEPRNVAPNEHAEVRWFGRGELDDLPFSDHRLRHLVATVLDDTR